jgi:hypothetical protein
MTFYVGLAGKDHNSGLAVKNGIARRRLQEENRKLEGRDSAGR